MKHKHFTDYTAVNPVKVRFITSYLFAFFRKKLPLVALFILLAVILLPTSSFAANKYDGWSVEKKATAYQYALILDQCFKNNAIHTNEANIRNGDFINAFEATSTRAVVWDKTIVSNHATLQDDNEVGCSESDSAIIKSALDYLGVDPIQFACALGMERSNNSAQANCVQQSGNFKFASSGSARQEVGNALKSLGVMDISNPGVPAQYLRNFYILENGCIGTKVSFATWDKEGGNTRYNFKRYPSGDYEYYLSKSSKNQKPRGANGSEKGTVNCRTYWERVNNNYDTYEAFMVSNSQDNDKRLDSETRDGDHTSAVAGEEVSSCVIEGVGWIICPIINFISVITDHAYTAVEGLLRTPPLMTSGDTSGTYQAWRVMQGFANAAFVIVFLIIIYSQITSAGISNYGVKKMLPRLVIAAILVNVSFFICAIAVDASNVLGGSIKSLLDGITIPSASVDNVSDVAPGNLFGPITAYVLAGAGAVAGAAFLTNTTLLGALALLIPGLLAAVAAILAVLVVLVIRQALIILLVAVSPLAFVAFLLPNTEGLFTKWRKLLTTLLLMFPIIAAIFGVSGLAATVVMNSTDNLLTQIAGALITIIPLAITPIVMKSAGGLLNRIGMVTNNKQKGLFDRANNAAKGFRKNQSTLRGIRAFSNSKGKRSKFGSFQRYRARRDAVNSGRESELNRARTGYIGSAIQEDSSFANAVAGGTRITDARPAAQQRVMAGAVSAVKSATEEDIKNVKLSADFKPGDLDGIAKALKDAIKEGDSVKARAYQDMLQSSGGPGIKTWRDTVTGIEGDPNSGMSEEMSNALRKRTMETNPGIKSSDAAAAKWANSQKSLSDIRNDASTWSGLSNEELMSQKVSIDKETGKITSAMGDALAKGAITKDRAIAMQTAESFNKMSEDVRIEINRIANAQQGPPSEYMI